MEAMLNSDFNTVKRARHGYIIYNRNDLIIGKSLEKYGEFSELEAILFQQLIKQDDFVVEVGANIGAHTLCLANCVGNAGRVFAFEPQRIVFQTLCGNLAINSITNVEAYQFAAGSENGAILLPDFNYDSKGNFGDIRVKNYQDGFSIQLVRLDDFLGGFIDIPRLNFIKVDVQGMEFDVLSGATDLIEAFKPILYVENDQVENSKQLIELIQSFGYRLWWHIPPLFNPNNYENCPENIFANIASFNMLCVPDFFQVNLETLKEITDTSEHPLKGV